MDMHACMQANKYYDLVTSFYEYGWGESFHFANRLYETSKFPTYTFSLMRSLSYSMPNLTCLGFVV